MYTGVSKVAFPKALPQHFIGMYGILSLVVLQYVLSDVLMKKIEKIEVGLRTTHCCQILIKSLLPCSGSFGD